MTYPAGLFADAALEKKFFSDDEQASFVASGAKREGSFYQGEAAVPAYKMTWATLGASIKENPVEPRARSASKHVVKNMFPSCQIVGSEVRHPALLKKEGASSGAWLKIYLMQPKQNERFTRPHEHLMAKFSHLLNEWHKETDHISSVTDIVMNFNYQQIIGMGEPALPLIFEELTKNGGHWFWALRAITGENPVSNNERGNMKKMKEAWLTWWINKGMQL